MAADVMAAAATLVRYIVLSTIALAILALVLSRDDDGRGVV